MNTLNKLNTCGRGMFLYTLFRHGYILNLIKMQILFMYVSVEDFFRIKFVERQIGVCVFCARLRLRTFYFWGDHHEGL